MSKNYLLPLVLLKILTYGSINGLIGYDCGTPGSNITDISILEVADCELPEPNLKTTHVEIQLLQVNDYAGVMVRQCKIEIERDIHRCGMFSHVSDVLFGKASYVYDLSKEECGRMFEQRSIRIDKTLIMGLTINQTTVHSLTLAGAVGVDGACEGESYADPYGNWNEVIVLAIIKVTLREYRTELSLKTNKVHLKSGIRCELSKGECLDIEGGFTIWDSIPSRECNRGMYGSLYRGIAEKAIGEETGTLFTVKTSEVIFALTEKSEINVCGQVLIRTDHPRLLIHEVKTGGGFLYTSPVDVSNRDIYAYINSKFVYVERHLQTEIQKVYYDLLVKKCELKRDLLKNRQTLAFLAPELYAYEIMKGPGYTAVIDGESAYIIKCLALEVQVRHMRECYAQLPVMEGNNTYFLAPKTHILTKTGVQIGCNRLLPPKYFIGGEWYAMMPEPNRVMAPNVIRPDTKATWKFTNTRMLATGGIYSISDLEELREHIMFPAERPAMINTVVRGMMGKENVKQGGSIMKLIDKEELSKMVKSVWGKIWNGLLTISQVGAGFFGMFIVIRIIKLIIDIAIHGYALHTVYGWSLYLIGAIWDSVTQLLLHLKRGAEGEFEEKKDKENDRKEEIKIEMEVMELEKEKEIKVENREEIKGKQSGKTLYPRLD